MADQLASASDLASLLQKDVDTASAVLALEVCTAVVQACVDGQRIVRVTNTEVVYGGFGKVLRLKQQPVVSITSVTYNGSLLTQGTASGNWSLSPLGPWRNLGWTEYCGGPVSSTAVYVSGYDPAGSDADKQALQLGRGAVLGLARGLFENPSGVIREQIDDYAVAYSEAQAALDASPGLKALLRKQYGPKARMVSVI
ncbi:MAG: hypothetical protein QOI76_783 [Frankiales bacterium]|jgi:hypothetical protein|nr:hypothetical protein [Frankiales bacterium]